LADDKKNIGPEAEKTETAPAPEQPAPGKAEPVVADPTSAEKAGKRSTQIVGDRNGMNYKQVQRYIRLTELLPDRRKIQEADIIMETRKGVALSYAPAQIAV